MSKINTKKLTYLILCIAFFAACEGNTPTTKSIGQRTPAISQKHQTTLDSLQGLWTSTDEKDSHDGIRINGNKIFYIVDRKIEEAAVFYLHDACSDKESSLSGSTKNGRFLIWFSKDDGDPMCYYIDYLTENRLVMMYNGHTNGYIKK